MAYRAELFFGSTWGITEPFGYLHQYRTELVDTETADKDCRHNTQLCEEMTHGKGEPSSHVISVTCVNTERDLLT